MNTTTGVALKKLKLGGAQHGSSHRWFGRAGGGRLTARHPVSNIEKIGTWSFDYVTSTLSWSSGTHEIFGTEARAFDGSPEEFLSHVHPEDRDLVESAIRRATVGDPQISVEYRIIRAIDGVERILLEQGEVHFDKNANPVSNVGVVIDVTERRETELRLQRAEALHRLAGRLARIGGWSIHLGSGKVIWSDEVCAIHGVSAGKSPTREEALAYFIVEHRHIASAALAECAESGQEFDVQLRIKTASGKKCWVRFIGEAVTDSGGRIGALQGVYQDLTHEKQTEVSVQNSLRQFTELADSMPFIVWTARPDGIVDFTNMAMIEYSGMPDLNLPDQRWISAIHPDDLGGCLEAWKEAMATGTPYLHQFRIRRQDGAYRCHQVGAKPSRDQSGAIYKWYGTAVDIDDRINMEADQRQAAERLTSILESITDAFYMLDGEWKFTYVNDEAERLLKHSRTDLLGRSIWNTRPDAKDEVLVQHFETAQRTGSTARFEFYDEPFGTWLRINVYPSSEGLAVYMRDVTERHEYEDRLQMLEAAVSRMSDLVIITEADPIDEPGPRITYVNESFERITGYSREEAIGRSPRLLQGDGTQRAELDTIRSALAAKRSGSGDIAELYKERGGTLPRA